MSERVGKIGLNACTPWSLFAENTAFEDSEGMADPKIGNTEAARLHKEDMRLFGLCPAKDNLILAVCKECQKIVQASMLAAHYERKHQRVVNSLKRSPSRRCSVSKDILSPSYTFGKSKLLKSPGDNSFIRIEEVDPTDINVKIEEVPLTIPKFNHSVKGKLAKVPGKNMITSKGKSGGERQTGNSKIAQKKQVVTKDKEYDPERHCGVWIEEQTRNCTRSLTCKTHSLASRREVAGRSKLFDVLLSDHKTRMQNSKESGSSSGATTPSATPSPTRTNTPTFPLKLERSCSSDPRSPSSKENSRLEGKRQSTGDDVSSPFNQLQPTYVDYITEDRTSSIPTISQHPKPMAINSFSARKMGSGCFLFSRKFETFRYAAQSMVDKLIRANSCTSNSQNPSRTLTETNGVCSNVNDGMGFRGTTSSSFSINSFSSTELNRFGSAPRVKTKPNKTSTSTNLKRQISDSYVPDDYFSSRKRRHSADSLKNDSVDKDSSLLENSNDNNNSRESAIDLAKCVNEIGQALRGFDVESLDANFLSSDLLSSDSTQSGMSNLTISGGNISTNLSADNSLSSSLSLCQTMGINHGVSSNLAVNLGGSQNPIVVEQGQVVNQLLAPNMAVTKGMMVSLPNVTQVQNLAVYQGNLKEILPAPSSVKQQCTSPGLYVTSQGQHVVSQLANGTVSSPETFSLSYSPNQSLSTANLNAALKAPNTSKRLSISSNQRTSQLVLRQPSQQLQNFQRELNAQRSNIFQKPAPLKPAPLEPHKGSSPSTNAPSPSRSPSQQPNLTAVTTQLLSNPQLSSSNQPLAHLKQIQMHQLQQQQHLLSPLNSTMQAESLSYQQQILPKLVVSPSRNLPAQIINNQAIQVNAQHMQQRSVLEPSTP